MDANKPSIGGKKMRKKRMLRIGLITLFLFLSFALFAGCAKKGPTKSEAWIHGGQKPTVQAPTPALTDDKETMKSALREQTLDDQGIRKQTLTDERNAGKASEGADREAVENEAAILKELRIPDIHFDFNEYKLHPENQSVLKAAAQAYLKHTNYTLVIEGHCDERGTTEYNLALGQRRADETAKFLIDLGITQVRIKTISYGKERPLDPGHDETALAKNRRVHFVVSQPVKQP
jgi:peptidoglycan-associated lipoprotein